MSTDPDWRRRAEAEARLHAQAHEDALSNRHARGCMLYFYLFSCAALLAASIVFPPLLLIVIPLGIYLWRRRKAGGQT